MKLYQIPEPGAIENITLAEAPDPAPGDYEVLIRVRAVSRVKVGGHPMMENRADRRADKRRNQSHKVDGKISNAARDLCRIA